MSEHAYELGREMIWSHTGCVYMDSFQRARLSRIDAPAKPLAIRTLEERHWELPQWRLDHLMQMTDSTGAATRSLHPSQLRGRLLHG